MKARRSVERCATDREVRAAIFRMENENVKQTGIVSVRQIRAIENTRADLQRIARGIEDLIDATRRPFAAGSARKLLNPEKALQTRYDLQGVLDGCWQIGEALTQYEKRKERATKRAR